MIHMPNYSLVLNPCLHQHSVQSCSKSIPTSKFILPKSSNGWCHGDVEGHADLDFTTVCVCVSCGGAVHAPTCPSIIQQPTVLDASPWFNAGHDGQDASFPLIDTEVVSCSACSRFTFDCETVCSGKVTVFSSALEFETSIPQFHMPIVT